MLFRSITRRRDQVVALPLEHLDRVALLVLAAVVGRADGVDVDQGETVVENGFFDDLRGLSRVENVAAGGEGRAGAGGKVGDIEGTVDVAVGRGSFSLMDNLSS